MTNLKVVEVTAVDPTEVRPGWWAVMDEGVTRALFPTRDVAAEFAGQLIPAPDELIHGAKVRHVGMEDTSGSISLCFDTIEYGKASEPPVVRKRYTFWLDEGHTLYLLTQLGRRAQGMWGYKWEKALSTIMELRAFFVQPEEKP